MPYQASTFRVMIASPGDVEAERRLAIEVIHEWNAINSEDRGIVLLPASWETHAAPEMGDRPQEVINRQVLRDCDLLVAIFWTRLGSPTGRSSSGTVEEINEHVAAGKPAMLYFSFAPVQPNFVDAEQLEALRAFREDCKRHSLYQEYASVGEFRTAFARQLQHTVIRILVPQREREVDNLEAVRWLNFTRPVPPQVSAEAKELLLAASEDRAGAILSIAAMGGRRVQTAGKNFVIAGDRRSEAKWLAALKELESAGFVEDRGHHGEVYELTREGFEAADALRRA